MRPTRWGIVAIAVAAAIGASRLAPDPWPQGETVVRVDYGGETVIEEPVGAQARTLVGGGVRVRFPSGVSHDSKTTAWVRVVENGEPLNPGLDAVKLTLTLADGREELLPFLRWDAKQEELEAGRRPPARLALALGLLALVMVLWISEAVPLHVTSLIIPVVLAVSGAQTAKAALAPFFHPIIALFFGTFLMAEAMRRVKLDHVAAVAIVSRAGRSPATLFAALLATSAFLSMWMSNTAATALLVPIALAITEPLRHLGYRKAVVLGIAYAATIGGVGSQIGTPANMIATEFLDTFVGKQISFPGWFLIGLPLVLLFLPVMGAYLWWRSKVSVDPEAFAETRRLASEERARAGKLTRDQKVVLWVFLAVVLMWLTQTLHHVNVGIIALCGAIALALVGRLDDKDLGRISWSALLTFGGGLCLGTFLLDSGTSDWLATRMAGLHGMAPLVGVSAAAFLALGLTAVASNTATAAMLVPLAIPMAGVLGVDATLLVLVVAIASSVDFAIVIGTPPTMIAFSTRLFKAREILRLGIFLDIAGIVILVTAVYGLWALFGVI